MVEQIPTFLARPNVRLAFYFFSDIRTAFQRWQEDEGASLAASVAYYLSLSLFPMLLLLVTGVGIFLRFTKTGQDAECQVLTFVAQNSSSVVVTQIHEVLAQLRDHSIVSGPVGIVTAGMAALGVFLQFERAFHRIMRLHHRESGSWTHTVKTALRERVRAFLMLFSLGLAVVLVFASNIVFAAIRSAALEWFPRFSIATHGYEICTTIFLNALLFAALFRWLPSRRVHALAALRGGLFTAIVWEIGRQLLGNFLIGMKYTSTYGVIGSFIAILLWCYYGVSIIFFGAEYVQAIETRILASRDAKRKEMHAESDAALQAANIIPFPSAGVNADNIRPDKSRPRIRPRRVA